MATTLTTSGNKKRSQSRRKKMRERAIAEYRKQNPEIAQAMEAMKQVQLIRRLYMPTLNRNIYQAE